MAPATLSKPQREHVTPKSPGHVTEVDLATRVTLSDVVADFLAEYERRERSDDVSSKTLEKYQNVLRNYASWLEAQDETTDMASLQGKHGATLLRRYLDYLKLERDLKDTSRATYWRALRRFWHWAAMLSEDDYGEPSAWPYVRRAPTDYIEAKEAPTDRPSDETLVSYSREETARMLVEIGPSNSRSLQVARDRAILLTFLYSGLRRSELAGLKVSDFNIEQGFFVIRSSVAKKTKRASGDDSRLAPVLDEAACRELVRYARRVRAEGMDGDDPLFPSLRRTEHYRQHMTPTSISHIVKETVDRVRAKCPNVANHPSKDKGCDRCVLHSGTHRLRRTWAVQSLEDGVAESAVKSAGGWSNYMMVDRYKGSAASRLAVKAFTEVRTRRR